MKLEKNGKKTADSGLSRRDFLKTGTLSSFALGAGALLGAVTRSQPPQT